MNVKKIFAEELHHILKQTLSFEEVYQLIEYPKDPTMGDLALPCFTLAKQLKKSPAMIASEIAESLNSVSFSRAEAVGPYVNVFLQRELFSSIILETVLNEQADYGQSSIGHGKTIVIDCSSPNIAKPFSMGHLRSTVIGNAIGLVSEKCGYTTVKINHLGDWGTQFGKLIAAYKHWGNETKVRENTIEELFILYKRFHAEAEHNPQLEDEGRAWFKRLEDGDEEATYLWKWFRDESLKEFNKIYKLLRVDFDSYNGEAFFNDKMDQVIELLDAKGLLKESEGADVVDLSELGLPPCLIKKSDGATLYATRDLAAAIYRQKQYHFDKSLYVVGHEQSVHFQQVFAVLKNIGYDWASNMKHIPFGLYLQDGKKMSTRKGRVILLENVLKEAIELAEKNIEEKNPGLAHKEEVAKAVGVGAIIFHDLKNFRMNNIEFSLEDMLAFEGETGPYVQYTHARACSILRKAEKLSNISSAQNVLTDDNSWEIIKLLNMFPDAISQTFNKYDPSIIAKFTIDLAKAFNKYYAKIRILEENDGLAARLTLVLAVTIVLKEGLRLIGVSAPDQM